MKSRDQHSRRTFIKKSLGLGFGAASGLLFGNLPLLSARETSLGIPDLVAVKNHTPTAMFDKGINMMGGMGRFVKKGQSVVVKPNIGFAKPPENGATTNPLLVKSVVDHCLQAGAKKVYVFDNVASSSYGMAHSCYEISGIDEAARSAGALVAPGDHQKYYQEVTIPGSNTLEISAVHELVLEADVFINVPILKDHSYSVVTGAMKNLMGIVWDRMSYHYLDLEQCIAEFCLFKKPDLNILDAYRVMKRHGPQGRDPSDTQLMKTLLISPDIVAIDTAATKLFGKAPEDVRYLKIGQELGIGTMQLDDLNIRRYVFS